MANILSRYLLRLYTNLEVVSIGTKFNPTNTMETEYVELFNYTQTILFELEKAKLQEIILSNGVSKLEDSLKKEDEFIKKFSNVKLEKCFSGPIYKGFWKKKNEAFKKDYL